MALVPYTITAIERDTADATASGKQIIVGAVCSLFIQPANTIVLLYDNAAGSNGSTAKVTGANGQVVVYVEPAEYRVSVNGSDSFKTIAREDSEFGTAATRDITTSKDDTTAGRLTKVGDFGLGGVSITNLANADDATIGSFQSSGQLTESTAIAANFPSLGVTGTTPVWWNVFSYAGATTRASQEATECFAITTGALLNVPRKFLRNQQDNNWDDWVEVLTTGNTNLNKFEGAAAEICATGHAASGTSAWFFFDIFKNTDPTGITTIGTFDIYRNATLVQAGVTVFFSNISSKRKALVTVSGLSGLTNNENLQLRFASTASIEF